MAYVTPRKGGRWELREAVSTRAGPRSRTLASFRELTPEVIERALSRARQPLTEPEARRAARRAGAPVAKAPAEASAKTLLSELAAGRPPRPAIARLLVDALPSSARAPSDAERAVAPWIGATLDERGEALLDLLLLADSLPTARRHPVLAFPGVTPRGDD